MSSQEDRTRAAIEKMGERLHKAHPSEIAAITGGKQTSLTSEQAHRMARQIEKDNRRQ